jgi:hypothetical protein
LGGGFFLEVSLFGGEFCWGAMRETMRETVRETVRETMRETMRETCVKSA